MLLIFTVHHIALAMLLGRVAAAPEISPRVVQGNATQINDYPFYVHLADRLLCGGSLIHKDIAMTAAHCGAQSFVGNLVSVGATFLYGSPGYSEDIEVDEAYAHEDYDATGNEENDIMLLRLTRPSDKMDISLHTTDVDPPPGTTLTAIGFGRLSEGGPLSLDLLQVQLNVQEFSICDTELPERQFEETQMCVGVMAGGIDTCDGDSGGPLFDPLTGIQYGIVSYGLGCARAGKPSIYTKVSAFHSWIASNVCRMSRYPPPDCFSPSVSPSIAPSDHSRHPSVTPRPTESSMAPSSSTWRPSRQPTLSPSSSRPSLAQTLAPSAVRPPSQEPNAGLTLSATEAGQAPSSAPIRSPSSNLPEEDSSSMRPVVSSSEPSGTGSTAPTLRPAPSSVPSVTTPSNAPSATLLTPSRLG